MLHSDLVEFPEGMCPVIAKLTEDFSFAYLKELFVIALITIAGDAAEQEDGVTLDAEVPTVVVVKDAEEVEIKESQTKRVVPEIEIPATLSDNLLLKVLRNQIKALLKEMDNTTGIVLASCQEVNGQIGTASPCPARESKSFVERYI